MKNLICAVAFFATVAISQADMIVSPWMPLFRGIDHAVGTNLNSTQVTNNGVVFTDSRLQVVHCVRVDLTDTNVHLFTSPQASGYTPESRETLSLSISNFIRNYGVQVASDANFYSANPGGSDPTSEGVPCEVYGLLISTGQVVSAADSSGGGRYASLMFTTNNLPIFDLDNRPPGTNTTGIFTAVTGYYPLLTNGVNVWALYYNDFLNFYTPSDQGIHGAQPRTAFGISQDKRYLFMLTLDGRQGTSEGINPPYSVGSTDQETAMWLLQFGAWDAINMDGGGSTAMYMADCSGNPLALNHSSLLASTSRPHERLIGSHFGVYAPPLSTFISGVAAVAGGTTATITWMTLSNGTSQVDYGLTQSYGTLSTNDPTMVTSHSLTLSNLTPATRYFFRVLSSDGTAQYASSCGGAFSTTNVYGGTIFDLTKEWKYSTANLDGINWQAPLYNDTGWTDPGPGVLWVDTTDPENPSSDTSIRFLPLCITPMAAAPTTYPYFTYYFRTHFTYTNSLSGVSLTFSNYIDDGAAFYLNGVEINRAYLASDATNASLALDYNCHPSGNATCPYLFTLAGALTTNLLLGDNVLAVEVHNFSAHSPDITFGQALVFTASPLIVTNPPPPFITNLLADPKDTFANITWTTLSNSTSQIRYGTNTSLTQSNTVDLTLVTNHSMSISNLARLTNYYFRVISKVGTNTYTADGTFVTAPYYSSLVSLTNIWAFQTNNLDGVGWMAPDYDETLFLDIGRALLYLQPEPAVAPLNTLLPPSDSGFPYPTYYFRTHFVFNTSLVGFSMLFTNYIDAGAVFYLNGVEIKRVRMPAPPQNVQYPTLATACAPVACHAATNAPDVFRISGDLMTNLIANGDNVLAVEVHPSSLSNSNIVFGSAAGLVRAKASETKLRIRRSGFLLTTSWDALGLTLQQSRILGVLTNSLGVATNWTDVGDTRGTNVYTVFNPSPPLYYRIRD